MSIEPGPKPSQEALDRGYETKDAPASPVVVSMGVLIALMFAGFVGGYIFKVIFEATEVRSREEASLLVQREPVRGPVLQAHPEVELDAYLQKQTDLLSTYAWIDREKGVVRIPIERAMDLIATNGLPHWEPPTAKLSEMKDAPPPVEVIPEPPESAEEAAPEAAAAPVEDEAPDAAAGTSTTVTADLVGGRADTATSASSDSPSPEAGAGPGQPH